MRKRLLRALALNVVPLLGSLLIRLFYFSSKKVWHLPTNVPEEPFITAFWHGDLIYQPFLYFQLRKEPNINVVISDHFDGQIIAKTIEHLNLNTIHGSSTRNAARVLIAAIKTLKNGGDIGITPDGPKGPRHEVADGVIMMAQKTKAKVIVFSCVPQSYWQLKSWDRFTIPKPFTRLDFYASEPLDLSGLDKEEARALVKKTLLVHDY